MAGTADVPNTLDELFQLLVRVRRIPAPIALKQIKEALELDSLRVDFHIRGGTRREFPRRPLTLEELALSGAARQRLLDLLYEPTPAEGVSAHVHWQSWKDIFDLKVIDERLIVVPLCGLGYPWEAYSFRLVTNRHVLNELWPAKPPLDYSLSSPRKLTPKEWWTSVLEKHPRRPKEGNSAYAERLLDLMEKAPVTKVWEFSTIRRRLLDR